jgi:cytochrome c-type biogenesis protein CcmH/NrfG
MNGKTDEAINRALESLELDEANGAAWDTYAVGLLKTGRVAEAEKAVRRALNYSPDHPEILYHLAQVYERQKRYAEALAILEKLLDRPSEMSMPVYDDVRRLASRLRDRAPSNG